MHILLPVLVLNLVSGQVPLCVAPFQVASQLVIIQNHYREEFVAAELARHILQVSDELIVALLVHLCLCHIGLLDGLLLQRHRVVLQERQLIAKYEPV